MEEYADEHGCRKDSRRCRKQGEQDGERQRDTEQGPAQIATFGCGARHKGKRSREIRVEACALNVSAIETRVVSLLADLSNNTATTRRIVDETSVNGSPTDKRVGAVVGMFEGLLLVCWSTNDQGPVVDELVAHSMRVEQLNASAVCRTAEWHGCILEGATEVTIQSTSVAVVPKAICASDAYWAAITRNVGGECTAFEYQGEGQQPAGIEGNQQGYLLLSLRAESLQELDRHRLYLGEERSDFPRSWWLRAFYPSDCLFPSMLHSRGDVLGGEVRLLGGIFFLVGSFGTGDQNSRLGGMRSGIVVVVAVDLRRCAFVIETIMGTHVIERAKLVTRGWGRQLAGWSQMRR